MPSSLAICSSEIIGRPARSHSFIRRRMSAEFARVLERFQRLYVLDRNDGRDRFAAARQHHALLAVCGAINEL